MQINTQTILPEPTAKLKVTWHGPLIYHLFYISVVKLWSNLWVQNIGLVLGFIEDNGPGFTLPPFSGLKTAVARWFSILGCTSKF
jgi:hypothetical protein